MFDPVFNREGLTFVQDYMDNMENAMYDVGQSMPTRKHTRLAKIKIVKSLRGC